MKKNENIIVGISIGDLNGIGSEVILKTFDDNRMLEMCTPVIFANVKIVSFIKRNLKLETNIHGIDNLNQLVIGKINVLNVWKEDVAINFGTSDDNAGLFAIKSFTTATAALKELPTVAIMPAKSELEAIVADPKFGQFIKQPAVDLLMRIEQAR